MSINKKIALALMTSTVAVLSAPVCAEEVEVQEELTYQDLGTGRDMRIAGAKKNPAPMQPANQEPIRPMKAKKISDADKQGTEGKCGEGTCGDSAKKKMPIDPSSNGMN